jgi:hypothetical protein
MLAHHQGGLLNVAQLARNLGVDGKTAAAYIDLLSDLLLVRRLPAWHANLGKRLVIAQTRARLPRRLRRPQTRAPVRGVSGAGNLPYRRRDYRRLP